MLGGICNQRAAKNEHLQLALQVLDGPEQNGFADIVLIPDAVPELGMDDIDLRSHFLGKTLACPIMINAMTGGSGEAKTINRELAALAARYGLAMAVGSQTVAMEDRQLADSFIVARETNPDGVLIANVSAGCPAEKALQAVEMIAADGLQLHFNLPQELAMQEGDRNFRGLLDNVGGNCVPLSGAGDCQRSWFWFVPGERGQNTCPGSPFLRLWRQRRNQLHGH